MSIKKTLQTKTSVSNTVVRRRKKNRFFETYISKVLKQVSPSNGITSNSKQQLNSALCFVSRKICLMVLRLTEIAKKKTISEKEIENSVRIILSGELALNSIREGLKSVTKFTKDSCKGSRQFKAGIVFPPSIVEKFLRNFGYSKVMLTNTAPIFLATVLEYITVEILEIAVKYTNNNKRNRISIRDLQLSIRQDPELSELFNKLNISFIGGGVIPYIHPYLLIKKPRKNKNIDPKKKTHRFRPGTVAIREIKRNQNISNCLTFAKIPFTRLVRTIINKNNEGMKISKDVFIILQYYIEQYIVNLLKEANSAAIHAGRVKLIKRDIEFICNLRGITVYTNQK